MKLRQNTIHSDDIR